MWDLTAFDYAEDSDKDAVDVYCGDYAPDDGEILLQDAVVMAQLF